MIITFFSDPPTEKPYQSTTVIYEEAPKEEVNSETEGIFFFKLFFICSTINLDQTFGSFKIICKMFELFKQYVPFFSFFLLVSLLRLSQREGDTVEG